MTLKSIHLLKYVIDPEEFLNVTYNPDNAQWFQYTAPTGLLNITAPTRGIPLFLSQPHFVNADPFYKQQFEGLKPEPELHETVMGVEPV